MSATHSLKCHPVPFQALWDGLKPYEVRHNDRGFEVGDTLILSELTPPGEWEPVSETCTGRTVTARVTYMTKGGEWGLNPPLCVLGLKVLARKG